MSEHKIYCHYRDCIYRKLHLCDHPQPMITMSPTLGCMNYKQIMTADDIRDRNQPIGHSPVYDIEEERK